MRLIRTLALISMAALAAPAFASMSGGSSTPEPKEPSSSGTPVDAASSQANARQQADRWYGDAYSEIAKAKKDIADKKDKNAEKRFGKAIEKAQHAIEIDSTYHEAWNLVGYASRKLKNYDQALAAYNKCLSLKFDYAPAREYLGEAYLELGKPDQAREQLALLEKLKAAGEAAELKASIDGYVATHPAAESGKEAAAASATGSAAPADTAAAKP